MNCPRCRSVALHTGKSDALEIRVCSRCGGVWLDNDDADKLLSWVKVEPWREAVNVDCAECGRPMEGRHVAEAQVVIDLCREHGWWFDHQELERLAGVVAHKRGRAAPTLPKPLAAGAAVVGVVAASAVGAYVLASADAPPVESNDTARHAADVAVETFIVAPEIAVVAADVGVAAVEVGAEAAGGIVSGIVDAIAGLLS